jgi:membrane-bound lytic murein transglycosylase A
VKRGPALASLTIPAESAARALGAFRISCPSLLRRTDASQLTGPNDWSTACAAAANWPAEGALQFFATYFETVTVGEGKAFATGYYEPRIAGSRTTMPGYEVPIYRVPDDLIDLDLGLFSKTLAGRHARGRAENGRLVPYHERAEIEDGALAGRGLEIAWAADPVDLFFLQIQGSGQLLLPDGSIVRIGYAGQNGRDYIAIGGLLRQRGLLGGPVSMQAITAWLRAHPDEGRAIMRENKSYIFFKELTGSGPLGALGRPLTPRGSVAADPKFVPLGAPLILVADRPEANGLWVAQDTGGAIKGANRFDTFWGAGDEAASIAGGMTARGQAWLLLPKGVLGRLENHAPAGR